MHRWIWGAVQYPLKAIQSSDIRYNLSMTCVCRLKRVPDAAVWPVIGDTTRFSGDGERLSLERYERYGSVFSSWLLGTRTTFVGSQDVMKWLLNKEHDLVEGPQLCYFRHAQRTASQPGSFVCRTWSLLHVGMSAGILLAEWY